jgi:hypothetical protein
MAAAKQGVSWHKRKRVSTLAAVPAEKKWRAARLLARQTVEEIDEIMAIAAAASARHQHLAYQAANVNQHRVGINGDSGALNKHQSGNIGMARHGAARA